MPTYEFKCNHCGHQFDRQLRIRDRQQTVPCPVCESTDTKKKEVSCFAIVSNATGMVDKAQLPAVQSTRGYGSAGVVFENCKQFSMTDCDVDNADIGVAAKNSTGLISGGAIRNVKQDLLFENSAVNVSGVSSTRLPG